MPTMPSFFRSGGSNQPQPAAPAAQAPQAASKDRFEVILHFEKEVHRVLYYAGMSVAAFGLQVFLATGVIPSRQKIIGFEKPGPAAPLMPDGDLSKAGMFENMQLSMTQLNIGQELEPRPLTPHFVDRIGANVRVLGERVGAIEQYLETGGQPTEKLHKLSMYMGEAGMKLMLKVDEIEGDDNVRAMRKALVGQSNQILDRIEKLKARLKAAVEAKPPSPEVDVGHA